MPLLTGHTFVSPSLLLSGRGRPCAVADLDMSAAAHAGLSVMQTHRQALVSGLSCRVSCEGPTRVPVTWAERWVPETRAVVVICDSSMKSLFETRDHGRIAFHL